MCRNITTLRGLTPPATTAEIEAAARQYVRKVSGVHKTSPVTEAAFEQAAALVAEATADLLAALPPRRTPPRTDPPLRRLGTGPAEGRRSMRISRESTVSNDASRDVASGAV